MRSLGPTTSQFVSNFVASCDCDGKQDDFDCIIDAPTPFPVPANKFDNSLTPVTVPPSLISVLPPN